MKIAHVIPIFKTGNREECANYRPISLLSNFNRIFEKILYSRIFSFFQKYNILNFHQYGFRPKHSTAMAVYDILETKLKNKDKGKYSCAVYLDLSKAFDTVDRSLLLKKLENYGIRGIPLELFKSYLSDRKQCTIINGTLSELLCIDLGVPQGSNLGPLLFLIYINDLPGASSLITKLFADDTCLLFSADSVGRLQNIANREINKIVYWMAANKLTLNHSKTKFMVITKNGRYASMNIHINGHQIEQVNSMKYLGITIDASLNWREQIKIVEGNLSQASGIISKMRHYVNFTCLKAFYYAKVFSYLQYAILAWGGCNDSRLHRINVIHNNIVRLMALKNLPQNFRISNKTIYKTFDILQFSDIYKCEMAKFMHKAYHNTLPYCLGSIFTRLSTVHSYPTSSSRTRTFYQILSRTTAYSNWLSTAGVKLWGTIDQNIKHENYKKFSRLYRTSILQAY